MKKVVSVVLAMVMALSIAACGGKSGTVEDYLNKPEIKSQIDETIEAIEGSGMSMEVIGEGNKMIYSYKFETPIEDEVLDTAKATLEEGVKAQESIFKQAAKELETEGKVKDAVVVIQYLNADGSEIYTVEYKAE